MKTLIGILATVLLCASCQQLTESGSGRTQQAFTPEAGATLSKWLDQRAKIYQHQMFAAPAGSDIRQAVAWNAGSAGQREVLLITRDYSRREDGQADPQSLYRIGQAGDAELLEVEGLPLSVIAAPNRSSACVALISQSGVGSFQEEQMSLRVLQGDAEGTVELERHALPAAYLGNDALQLQQVSSFQLDGGLLAPAYARDGGCFVLRLNGLSLDQRSSIFRLNERLTLAAALDLSFDPADPGAGAAELTLVPWPRGGQPALCQFDFPLHVSYSPFAWQPQLSWIDDDRLAALVFMPDLVEEGRRASFHGLFKLVVLGRDGSVDLVEDHLSGDLPFHASGGLLFYTRRESAGNAQRWEVWASSPDGMYKRLVWSSTEPVYISLEDADAGTALLLHVQTLNVFGAEVSLDSRLIRLSLEPPENPPQAEEPQAAEGPQQAPPGSKPPPIAAPDGD